MSEKLKNCPFCGSSKIIVWGKDIMCDDCEAKGPARQTIARAKEEWNRRVEPVRYKDCKY